jgi:hypothetical protein
MKTKTLLAAALVGALATITATSMAQSQSHYDDLANLPFVAGYIAKDNTPALLDESFFERAVQTYLWAIPALNMYGMMEGSEKVFGKGYNVLPVWKQRLNAKTLVTTPNSDVIYAMGYLDLKEEGPIVIEVPPRLQGILDDFWQRPIPSVSEIDGRTWAGDVGFAGPDRGKGGKYLLLAPDYAGEVPPGYFTFRSGTYGVFVFWRAFFKDPTQLAEPVRLIEQTRIYPLGKKDTAKPMQFPDASGVPANMLYPQDGTAFDMFNRFIQHEYVDPTQLYMRGMAAELGIVKGQPFAPDTKARALLDKAARAATRIGHVTPYSGEPLLKNKGLWYPGQHWINVFPGNATFTSDSVCSRSERWACKPGGEAVGPTDSSSCFSYRNPLRSNQSMKPTAPLGHSDAPSPSGARAYARDRRVPDRFRDGEPPPYGFLTSL